MFSRDWFIRDGVTYQTPPDERMLQEQAISVDCAFKGGASSDYVVMQCWGRQGARYWLLDQVRARLDYPQTRAALQAFAAKHPRASLKLVEDKANGSALIADLRAHVPGLVPYDPKASKEARASIAASCFEAGNVLLPSPRLAPWIGDYIEELCAFPSGTHDDQVDATSQILIRWTQSMPVVHRGGWRG
jgi:predicted phage terminase large subunit-like protein